MDLCACSQGASVAKLVAPILWPPEPRPPGTQEPRPVGSLWLRAGSAALTSTLSWCRSLSLLPYRPTPAQACSARASEGKGPGSGGVYTCGPYGVKREEGRPCGQAQLIPFPLPPLCWSSVTSLSPLLPQGFCSCCSLSLECCSPRYLPVAHYLPASTPLRRGLPWPPCKSSTLPPYIPCSLVLLPFSSHWKMISVGTGVVICGVHAVCPCP